MNIFINLGINGELSRATDVHQDEHHQIDECQFALDDAGSMDMDKSRQHDNQHRNHAQSEKGTGHESQYVASLDLSGKYDEQQRYLTTDIHRVGEDVTQFGVVVHFFQTMEQKHQSEEDSQTQQKQGKAFGIGGLGE